MLYVYANVKVKYGRLAEFNDAMITVKRVMETNGWRLAGAWTTLVGDLHAVHDLWQIDDANAVAAAFAGAYEDPDFLQAVERLSTVAEREVLSLLTKTPYSP